jgi:hypothetical protein
VPASIRDGTNLTSFDPANSSLKSRMAGSAKRWPILDAMLSSFSAD